MQELGEKPFTIFSFSLASSSWCLLYVEKWECSDEESGPVQKMWPDLQSLGHQLSSGSCSGWGRIGTEVDCFKALLA